MSAGTKIDRKGEALITALLTEPTHAAAVAKAGVSGATAQRWLNRPAFVAAYRAARRAVVEAAVLPAPAVGRRGGRGIPAEPDARDARGRGPGQRRES
jgi:hypothetical protein